MSREQDRSPVSDRQFFRGIEEVFIIGPGLGRHNHADRIDNEYAVPGLEFRFNPLQNIGVGRGSIRGSRDMLPQPVEFFPVFIE